MLYYSVNKKGGDNTDKRNYQHELEKIIGKIGNNAPKLMLHSCCAPCSSYVIEYLSQYFEITVFYYNPNIYPDDEYHKRAREQQEFISQFPTVHKVSFIEGEFDVSRFYASVQGMEDLPERGERCMHCFKLRLAETARVAKENGADYFATTLTISPKKKADDINSIGEQVQAEYGVPYLASDFKKKDGYKRSTELSHQYGMYRQDYCGCVFSYRDRHSGEKD